MTDYPVIVRARLDEPLSGWLWLVKWILIIPHAIVLAFLWLGYYTYGALGTDRVLRVAAYVALMTDVYPPLRLEQGGDEPLPPDGEQIGST
jgi:hypothetical protein